MAALPHDQDEIRTVPLDPNSPEGALSGPYEEIEGYLQPGRPGTLGRLEHYEVLEVLGQGGFGIVVKALDEKLQRPVAIKVLSPRLAVTSPPRKFFLREARSAAKVRHENVVQIHGVEEEPLPYLVMEFIDGETLQDRLDRTGPIEGEEAVAIGRQIALGLAAAHATGLIHRDVKPANILLERGCTPRVKITDFGIARTADDASLTQSGFVVGTPMYMAPEQAEGRAVDRRADLFSLGSLLYAMVSGRPPFRAPTALSVLKRVALDDPRPIRQINPEVPLGLCAVIARLHAKDPEDRYATAEEVVAALDRCLTEIPPPPRRPLRRGVLAGAGVAALLALIAVVALAGRRDAAAQPLPPAPNPPAAQAERTPQERWERSVAELALGDQVAAVALKLQAVNPGFDALDPRAFHCEVKDRKIVAATLTSHALVDLSPLRALKDLKVLRVETSEVDGRLQTSLLENLEPLRGLALDELHVHNSAVTDLRPLRGLQLKVLSLWGFAGHDLSPLQGMRLTFLNVGGSPVRDLSPLRGMPLTFLCLNHAPVADLSPLQGMPLQELLTDHTQVADLAPLRGLPLKHLTLKGLRLPSLEALRGLPLERLHLDYDPDRHRALLASLPTLHTICDQPAADFLRP